MGNINSEITKIDAVEMQLDVAIFLFFENRNIVASETIVSSSLGILRALVEKQGLHSPIWESDFIKDEYRKDWKKALNQRANYLKHADTDFNKCLIIDKDVLIMKLMEANHLYVELCKKSGRKLCANTVLFHIWFSFKYPEMMKKESVHWEEWMNGMRDRSVNPDNLEYFLELSTRNRI